MKQPLAPAALAFCAGIVLAELHPVPLVWLLGVGALLLVLALGSTGARPLALLAVTTIAGASAWMSQDTAASPFGLRRVVPTLPSIVTVRGSLADSPALRVTRRQGVEHPRTVVPLRVEAVRSEDAWSPAEGLVLVTSPGTLPSAFFRDQRVEVTGVLQMPRVADAEGLFDYREFLRYQGIHRQLVADGPADWRIADGSRTAPPWSERFLPWAREVLARGLPPEDESLQLLWAMTLGWKTALTDEVEEPFMRSGTMHVFAISGLHIALISVVIVAALRLLRLGRAWCGAVAIPLTWFYVAATGWQPSAIRSAVMMSIVVGGWALRRPGDLLNSLAGAALVILIWQPGQLFLPGFQLSFGVVCSMALLGGRLYELWNRLVRFDPLIPDDLRPRWQRWLGTPLDWLGLNLATALSAWVGSLPLVWQYFHLVNPISLVANLVVVPLSSAALVSNLASLLCGSWLPSFGEIFNASAWVWMTWMARSSQWFAALPGGSWNVQAPPVAGWIPYYALVWAVGTGWAFAPKRRWVCAVTTVVWLVAAVIAHQFRESHSRITLLAGGPTWMDLAGQSNDALLDCGDETATAFATIPLLRARGVDALPALIISHADTRHAGGARAVLERFEPGTVLVPGGRFRSPADKQLRVATDELGIRLRPLVRGDRLGPWDVLHPDATDRFKTSDDQALVLAGEVEGIRILLCSDLGRSGQSRMLERLGSGTQLRADILVAGVPISGEPLCDALLDAVKPQLIVVTSAEFPVSRRVRPATRERLAALPCPTWYLHQCGTVTLDWEDDGCVARSRNASNTLRIQGRR